MMAAKGLKIWINRTTHDEPEDFQIDRDEVAFPFTNNLNFENELTHSQREDPASKQAFIVRLKLNSKVVALLNDLFPCSTLVEC